MACLVGLGLGSPARAAEADAARKKALALNAVTGTRPLQGEILRLAEDPAGTAEVLTVAARMAKDKPQPFNLNATIILASAAEKLKKTQAAETFYRLHAEQALKLLSVEGLVQAYCGREAESGGLIKMLLENKKYAECEKACREFLGISGDDTIDKFKPRVLRRLIVAQVKQGHTDDALKLVGRLAEAQPDNWLVLEMKGSVLREAGKLDQAIKTYHEVLEQIRKDKTLKKDDREEYADEIRYILSGLYVDKNDVDKAAEYLKGLLAKQPNNPTYNNDLGYIWADHDLNLAESEKMIRRAIEEDRKQRRKANPDLKAGDKPNPAYLDSLGWVLYKQKKFKEARTYLREAVKDKEGQHVEIYDHLGDVLMALGEKAEAVKVWKEAIKSAGDSKREKERKAQVEKKIKANE